MVCGNLTKDDPQHAAAMIRFAMRAQEAAAMVPCPDATDGSTLKMRIGESTLLLCGFLVFGFTRVLTTVLTRFLTRVSRIELVSSLFVLCSC